MRYYQPKLSNYQSTFVPLPLDFLNQQLQETQKNADHNRDVEDQMGLLFAKPVLDQDLATRNQLVKEHQARVDQAIKGAQGDYSKLTPFLRDEYKRVNNNLTMGQLGAAYGNYNSYVGYQKDLDEKLKKGEISKATYNTMLDSSKYSYKGVGQDDGSGKFNSFDGRKPVADIDLIKESKDFFEGWKADSMKSGSVSMTPDGMYNIKTTNGWEKVDEKQLYDEGMKYFQNTPKYTEYANQRAFVDNYNSELHGLPEEFQVQEYETKTINGKKQQVLVDKTYSKDEYLQKYGKEILQTAANAQAEKYGYTQKVYDEDLNADPYKLKGYEHDLEHPTPMLVGKELDPLKYGTTYDNPTSVKTAIQNTDKGLREEFKKLLISTGTNENTANILSEHASIEEMNRNINNGRNSKYKGLTDKFDSLKGSYENINLLEKQAEAAADKIVPKVQIQEELKAMPTLPTKAKMTKEDQLAFIQSTQGWYRSRDGVLISSSGDNAKANEIAKRYGYTSADGMFGEIYKTPEHEQYNKLINGSLAKHEKAKEDYLKQNSEQRLKENIVLNKAVILSTDANGNTIVDTDNTNAINKQVDAYWDKNEFNDVYTEVPNEQGGFYTVGQLRQIEADKLESKDPSKVQMGKPWYAQYSESSVDSNGNPVVSKPMYVEIGGKAVKINQNKLYVNYGAGLIPLSQVQNTPQNATENWLATTANYGIKEKPIEMSGGTKVIVKNAKTAGNYANNNDLMLQYYNNNGILIGTETGPAAYNKLVKLQQEGYLK